MIMDSRLEFADAVSVAAGASTVLLTNQVDIGTVRDIGNGEPIYLVINVDTAIVTAASAGTIQYRLVSDDSASIHASTCTVHYTSPAFATGATASAAAFTTAGSFPVIVELPTEGPAYERYLGVQAIIGTTEITAGKVNAFLTKDKHGNKIYPDATN